MKTHTVIRAWCGLATAGLLTLAALGGAPARAATPATWESAEFHATVAGTSTLHDWNVESRAATGELKSDLGSGWLRLEAKSLAGGPKGLNERMYAALKADAHPAILFETQRVTLPADTAAGAEIDVPGRLTIAGTTREVTLRCRLASVAPGRLVIETEATLKMTDFGIKPPTFMGMVRTGDAVTVKVRWRIAMREAAARATVVMREDE